MNPRRKSKADIVLKIVWLDFYRINIEWFNQGKECQKEENNPYMHVCDDILLKIYVKIMSDYVIFSIEFDIISSTNVGCRSLD